MYMRNLIPRGAAVMVYFADLIEYLHTFSLLLCSVLLCSMWMLFFLFYLIFAKNIRIYFFAVFPISTMLFRFNFPLCFYPHCSLIFRFISSSSWLFLFLLLLDVFFFFQHSFQCKTIQSSLNYSVEH